MDEFLKNSGFMMDFWHDDIKFVTQIKGKSGQKKNVVIISK
jgi:hypothetical protein